MRIQYTTRATKSLGDIAIYLRKNSLDSVFIKNYIEEIREEDYPATICQDNILRNHLPTAC